MTEVSFHFNAPHVVGYACRMLRKAARQGAKVAVTGSADTLGTLDSALWTFEALDFVPHVRVVPGAVVAERLHVTPIWLVDRVGDAPHHEVLVNLGDTPPAGFETFARVIEIVGSDDAARAAGRLRWKHYASRGYEIKKHEVAE